MHSVDPTFHFILITGFVFSENEHTALEQFEGGPCAVIAPVQVWFNLKLLAIGAKSPFAAFSLTTKGGLSTEPSQTSTRALGGST